MGLKTDKGSGKDHVCRVSAIRVAYLLLCLRSPQDYYGLPQQDSIHILNVASNAHQAKQAFFDPLVRAVKRGWFADKCDPKGGIGLVTWKKGVESISGHADAESQEGLNIMLGIADEIDAFKVAEEIQSRGVRLRDATNSVDSILRMLRSSGSSRFDTFKNVFISYPRYKGSKIQSLTRDAKEDVEKNKEKSRHYVSGPLKTWDVNPRFDKYERVTVPGTKEPIPNVPSIVEDYLNDAGFARSVYECDPSPAFTPYYRNQDAVEACFVKHTRPPIEVSYKLVTSRNSVEGRVWEPIFDLAPDFYPIAGASYVMHGDLALNGDRAGIAMAHCVSYDTYDETIHNELGEEINVRESRPIIKVDFVIPLSASKKEQPEREIKIAWARDLAALLIKRGFNIVRYTFDIFQSQDMMQQLRDNWNIESYKVSTGDPEVWKNLRDLMYEGRIKIPHDDLLLKELFSLSRLANGKVDHPVGGSKDVADALACATLGAVKVGGRESETGERSYFESPSITLGAGFEVPIALSHLPERISPLPIRPDTIVWDGRGSDI